MNFNKGFDPELVAKQRSEKQKLVRQEILLSGYDPADFAKFMADKRPNGTDIDSWSYSQIQYVISQIHNRLQLVEEYKIFSKPTLDAKQIAKLDKQQAKPQSPVRHDNPDLINQFYQAKDPYAHQQHHNWREIDLRDSGVQQQQDARNPEPSSNEPWKIVYTNSVPMPTVLSSHNNLHHGFVKNSINFKVCDPSVHQMKGAIKVLQYRVQTPAPFNWEVRRTDHDFSRLYEYLFSQYPHVIIPPLPSSLLTSNIKVLINEQASEGYYQERCQLFEKFLRDLLNPSHLETSEKGYTDQTEVIRSDYHVYEFLSSSYEAYQKVAMSPLTQIQSVRDLITVDGQIKVYNFESMIQENEQIASYIKNFESQYAQLHQSFKDIQADFEGVCHTLSRIKSSFEGLSQLHSTASWHPQINNPETFYYYQQQNPANQSRISERLQQANKQFAETFQALAYQYSDQEQNPLLSPQTRTFLKYYTLVGESLHNHYDKHIKSLLHKLQTAGANLPPSRVQDIQDLLSVIVWETRCGLVKLEERLYERDFKALQALFKLKLIGQV